MEILARIEGDQSASALVRRLVCAALRDSGIPGPWQPATRGKISRSALSAENALNRVLDRGIVSQSVRRAPDTKRASVRNL